MRKGTYKGQEVSIVRGANKGDFGFTEEMKSPVLVIDKDGKKLVVPAADVMVSIEGNI